MARHRRSASNDGQLDLLDVREVLSTAPCVPAIREAVKAWKGKNCPGITETTRELLNFWFGNDHKTLDGRPFRYHDAQREAIETLIYLYEARKVRRRKDLIEQFAYGNRDLRLPPYDEFARYCVKMATGSGKTKVMALAIVWQHLNAVRENEEEYAKTFLILAPNIIVLERLQTDFASGRIFRTDPLIPKRLEMFWDFDCYVRGDMVRAHSDGALFLTNVQQFYERRKDSSSDEPEEMTSVLGPKPPASYIETPDFAERIAKRDGLLLVLNDEAHHTHDEDNEWNQVIRRLHTRRPVVAQLDFSATPRYSNGNLFAWTVCDYPLKQAIEDGKVKRPLKGIPHIDEAKSDVASVRYAGFLTAGVERWREYRDSLTPLNKKPILFLMLNSNAEADEVAAWLRVRYPHDFGGEKALVIHTVTRGKDDEGGGISKEDLEKARKLVREVDDETSPVNAIVSVLMLREGWDVRNVTVVVGLRPYSAKANILPEQTIGRGLRLMFSGESIQYPERVDIIGNKAFLDFVEELERLEDFTMDTFEVGKDRLEILSVVPMLPGKADKDIGIPELTPSLVWKRSIAKEIEALDVSAIPPPNLPLNGDELMPETFRYEGQDFLTKERVLERQYQIPVVQTPQEVIGYYAHLIARNLKLPSQFAVLAPKVREFFERCAFGKEVNLDDPTVIRAMSTPLAAYIVTHVFTKRLREALVEEKTPKLLTPQRLLSQTPPFAHARFYIESPKTVFNLVACGNQFEVTFAKFLDRADDVEAFSKLPEQFGFSIEYTNSACNLRHYYPDFVARVSDGTHWLIETKGLEDVEVRFKEEAAIRWCENATALTGVTWRYLKVPQRNYESLHPATFEELRIALSDFLR